MPNQNRIHDKDNPKSRHFPEYLDLGKVLGFTGEFGLDKHPTIYFTEGHWTQTHKEGWNIGWESYAGFKCLFFGNVISEYLGDRHGKKVYNHSFHDLDGKQSTVDDHLKNLNDLGKNRFVGGQWILGQSLDNETRAKLRTARPGSILRLCEFWIEEGITRNVVTKGEYFAHGSHHGAFTGVVQGDPRNPNWQNLVNELPWRYAMNTGDKPVMDSEGKPVKKVGLYPTIDQGLDIGGDGLVLHWKMQRLAQDRDAAQLARSITVESERALLRRKMAANLGQFGLGGALKS